VPTRRASLSILVLAVLGLHCAPAPPTPPPALPQSTAAPAQEAEPPQQPGEPQPAGEPAKARVLFLTQSAGFQHGSVRRPETQLAPAEIAMIQLGEQTGLFEVHATQDAAADFTRDNLQNYDVVMFYTTSRPGEADPSIAKADLEYFLNEWLTQKGHGFIGFHSATDTYHTYEPYWDMIGGTFDGHPWGSKTTVTISVHDTSSPMMQPFGPEFEIQDEIYQYKNWQPEKVHVLASLNMAKCDPKQPYHVPVAWCKQIGEGRVYYNNLGHNETTWTDERFLKSVENAVKWITGAIEADAAPNPEVSAAEDEKAKADAGEVAPPAEAAPETPPAAEPAPPQEPPAAPPQEPAAQNEPAAP
jgi:type 1 glutamine amidotransferase